MQDKTTNIFETADLGLAAYLLVQECVLVVADREKNRYSFVFEDFDKCRRLAIQYVNS